LTDNGNIGGAAQTVIYFALIFIAPFGFAFFLVYKKLTKQLKKEVTKERFGSSLQGYEVQVHLVFDVLAYLFV